MIDLLPLILVGTALLILAVASAIDLKYWILPDELNLALALAGIAFHVLTGYQFVSPSSMALGALIGAGMLFVIRHFSNRHYGRDTLGLGDVKLLGAAGLWLGTDQTLVAITLGAGAGLLHGIGYAVWLKARYRRPFSVSDLSIPAGPGFAVGIVAAGWMLFGEFIGGALR